MTWRRERVDVNNGKKGSRWNSREVIKLRTKKLRRRWSKLLSKVIE